MTKRYKCALLFIEHGTELSSLKIGESVGGRVLYGADADSQLPQDLSTMLIEFMEVIEIVQGDLINEKPKHREQGHITINVFDDDVAEVMLLFKYDVISRFLIDEQLINEILRLSRDLLMVEAMRDSISEHLFALQDYEATDFDINAVISNFDSWKERAEDMSVEISHAAELKLNTVLKKLNSGWETITG